MLKVVADFNTYSQEDELYITNGEKAFGVSLPPKGFPKREDLHNWCSNLEKGLNGIIT